MAMRGTSSVGSRNVYRGFMAAFVSAVLEWLLLFMLFLGAIYSYLVTKFARYCELQIPCVLCSRLDHVFGNEKDGFCWDLFCSNHKLEISSLVLCHVHNKLIDAHRMCENCLFSFAKINKSKSESCRSLVGKFGSDSHLGFDPDPLLQYYDLGPSGLRNCSCCNEPWISGGYAPKLLQTKSVGLDATELGVPLSTTIAHNCDDLKKKKEEPSGSTSDLKKDGIDPLSHIEYTQVHITSDSESEIPLPHDVDDATVLIPETDDHNEDFTVQFVHLEPRIITLADDRTTEKLIPLASTPEPSLFESQALDIVDPHHGATSVPAAAAIGHGLEELIGQQVECKADPSAPSERSSFDEVPPSSKIMEIPVEVSSGTFDSQATGEVGQNSLPESGEIKVGSGPIIASKTGIELNRVLSDASSQMPNYLDLGDAYKIAVGNRGRQLSGVLSEQRSTKDSTRVSEDLKLLLSQMSFARGIELSLNDTSPRVSGNNDELKVDSSSSIGMQILQRRISLERNESGLSVDGSIVSEIEGESVVDRLNRQIEHDRKLMSALYKELEEERSASAVAVNQAMAMITRLQEEKATLHMETLQCLRMMEEQAEYDGEALQNSNEFLAEKEKEIQDLEAELELYRKKFGESVLENILEPTCDGKAEDVREKCSVAIHLNNSASVPGNSIEGTVMSFGDKSADTANDSLLEFENERLYVLNSLKKLEKRLQQFSNNGVPQDVPQDYFGKEEDGLCHLKELNSKGGSQVNSGSEENDLPMQNDATVLEEIPCGQEGFISSFENPHFGSNKSIESDCGGEDWSLVHKESDFVALVNEVSNLSGRLKALEADRNFLEHSFNTLKDGDEGLKFIQEIACHLRELRRIGINEKN
ncbi:myosin-binding protein 1-like [Cornus florida]|uniref:myosin-binding protein 1-like n=1 Tax=Cornus florida TaxID=4283 RepID=UPI00289871A1|nr:myosin-binding protein 1-like [Cornus florida]XP_059652819.1 myosin-binding protein 1-like [Cornus florida]